MHIMKPDLKAIGEADFVLIDSSDFREFPPGGTLAFSKQLMRAFGRRVALVGFSTDNTPVGRWVIKDFGSGEHVFFSIGRWQVRTRRPLLPGRLRAFIELSRCKREILAAGIRCAFTQCAESLLAVHRWGWDSLCFMFPGTESPVGISRYPWARPFRGVFDRLLARALRRADVLLAAADQKAIRALASRFGHRVASELIVPFPTRFESRVFMPQCVSPKSLGLQGRPVITTCGRLGWQKGWDLLLDAFRLFLVTHPQARLVFVGDGEDRCGVELRARQLGVHGSVTITGALPPARVAAYLNAADLVVVGSRCEGWSVAMLEALGCGKPVVATAVSGASELICDGENGFIVPDRDPEAFAQAIRSALALEHARAVSLDIASRYRSDTLARDLTAAWPALWVHPVAS